MLLLSSIESIKWGKNCHILIMLFMRELEILHVLKDPI